ncbi:hypothetical protein RCL1_003815 [Eukaryota sp. TZLM3-RCL]
METVENIRAEDLKQKEFREELLCERRQREAKLISDAKDRGENEFILKRTIEFSKKNALLKSKNEAHLSAGKQLISNNVASEFEQLHRILMKEHKEKLEDLRMKSKKSKNETRKLLKVAEIVSKPPQFASTLFQTSKTSDSEKLIESTRSEGQNRTESQSFFSRVELNHVLPSGNYSDILTRLQSYPALSKLSLLEQKILAQNLYKYRQELNDSSLDEPSFSASPSSLLLTNCVAGEVRTHVLSLCNVYSQRASFIVDTSTLPSWITVDWSPPGKLSPGMSASVKLTITVPHFDAESELVVKTELPKINSHAFLKIPVIVSMLKHSATVSLADHNIINGDNDIVEIGTGLIAPGTKVLLLSFNQIVDDFSYGTEQSFPLVFVPHQSFSVNPLSKKKLVVDIFPRHPGDFSCILSINSTSLAGSSLHLVSINGSGATLPIKVIKNQSELTDFDLGLIPLSVSCNHEFSLLNTSSVATRVSISLIDVSEFVKVQLLSPKVNFLQPSDPYKIQFSLTFLDSYEILDGISDSSEIFKVKISSKNCPIPFYLPVFASPTDNRITISPLNLSLGFLVVDQPLKTRVKIINNSKLKQSVNIQSTIPNSIKCIFNQNLIDLAPCSTEYLEITFLSVRPSKEITGTIAITSDYDSKSIKFLGKSITSPVEFSTNHIVFPTICDSVNSGKTISFCLTNIHKSLEELNCNIFTNESFGLEVCPQSFILSTGQSKSIIVKFDPSKCKLSRSSDDFSTWQVAIPIKISHLGIIFDVFFMFLFLSLIQSF